MGKEEARWEAVEADRNIGKKCMAYCWITWREVAGRSRPPFGMEQLVSSLSCVNCEPPPTSSPCK